MKILGKNFKLKKAKRYQMVIGGVVAVAALSGVTFAAVNNDSPANNNAGKSSVSNLAAESEATELAQDEQTTQPSQQNTPSQQQESGGGEQGGDEPETPPEPPAEPTYSDTYPADWRSQCGGIDTWGFNKCQSVSYTAWKVQEAFGNMPMWGAADAVGNGDAKNWPAKAQNANIPTGTTPKLHSVAVKSSGASGVTAWVEAVNGDKITISVYNFGTDKTYRLVEDLPASYFDTYIYFGD